MRCDPRYQVRAIYGLTGTGESTADGMSGFRVCGGGLRMPGPTGAIRTMTITTMAGNCMRAIGTMRIMAITMGTITAASKKSVKKKTRQRPGLLLISDRRDF